MAIFPFSGIINTIVLMRGLMAQQTRYPIRTAQDLACALRARRKELKITQKEMAKYCDLSHTGIGKIEMGVSDVKVSTLLKISRILGFKIDLEMDA